MSEKWLYAEDAAQFSRSLGQYLQPIPARGLGQTKKHRENWTLAHALKVNHCLLGHDYPLTIWSDDRPDFRVEWPHSCIGVEVTEAIPTALAHAYSVVNRMSDAPNVLDLGHYRFGAEATDKREIERRILKSDFSSPMWIGDEPEREWADCIARAIGEKVRRSAEGHYDSANELHLLIYEDVGAPGVQLMPACRLLRERLADLSDKIWQSFHSIHILTNAQVITFQNSFQLPR